MEPLTRPHGMDDSAAVVHDMMLAIASNEPISTALIEGDLEHSWINASLFNAIKSSGLQADVELVHVRTCNYPLPEYDKNMNLPDVNYRSTLCLRAGDWLFDSDSAAPQPSSHAPGFAIFPSATAAIARDIDRHHNPHATWHHDIQPARGASYTGQRAPAMVAAAIAEPLARHLAAQMQRSTPSSPKAPSPRL